MQEKQKQAEERFEERKKEEEEILKQKKEERKIKYLYWKKRMKNC